MEAVNYEGRNQQNWLLFSMDIISYFFFKKKISPPLLKEIGFT